ncbi:MAG: sugar phosphate isomerase/epimerase [Ruminococcaceae bacterium]|nr:sugar phosphate isomerase/epimerase [Oscillospiraceae bacterium]
MRRKKYLKLREQGFEAIDIDIADTTSFLYTEPFEKAKDALLHHKKLIDEAGIEISQTHGPWRWPNRDYSQAERDEWLNKMQYSIRLTKVLDCKYFVIHPIMPFTVEDTVKGYEKETWELNLEFMRKLLVTAKEEDVTICLENMPFLKFSISTPEQIYKFIKEINDDHFKMCLDTGHTAVFYELDLANEVRRIGDELRVLHVHDSKWRIDCHMFPYFGRINWDEFAKALKEVNYKGAFSLEAMPPKALPDELFDMEGTLLCRLAANVCKDL